MDTQQVVQDSARTMDNGNLQQGIAMINEEEKTNARQADAVLSRQAEDAVVAVPVTTPPVRVVQAAPTTTKVITTPARTVACSPRCIVVVIFLLVLMLVGVYLSILAMGLLNGGINKEIDRFGKENERLERINEEYTRNNEDLEKNIEDVTQIGNQLDDQINTTRQENVRFRVSLSQLAQAEAELSDELERLIAVRDGLNQSALDLQDGLFDLQGSQLDINSTIQQFENQLALYQELRGKIEDYVDGSESSAIQAVVDYNTMVQNLRDQASRSIMLNLFNIASSTEKQQDQEVGFTKTEFERLVNQSVNILGATGNFNASELQFPGSDTQVVPTVEVLQILQNYINSANDSTLAANVNFTLD